jgi:hypothetical protein
MKLAVTKSQAADMLSISLNSFERYVMADLKLIRKGRLVLVPVDELGRWVERNAERTIEAA